MAKELTIRERLVRIETLMENHLRSHYNITIYLLCPILVGILLLLTKIWLIK